MEESRKKLKWSLFSLTLIQISNYVLPLISVPIISRIIGPERYGEINYAVAYVTYFNLIIAYSFDFTATRKITKAPADVEVRNSVFSEVLFTQCILFCVSTTAFVFLLFAFERSNSEKCVIVFSYLTCISTLFTQNWLYQAMQDLSKIALLNFLSKIFFTILIIILVKDKDDYILQPLIVGIIQIVASVASFVWALNLYELKVRRVPLKRCIEVIKEERTIFFSLVVVNLYTSTNIVILRMFQNSSEVGFYTAGQRLILIAQSILILPISQIFYPLIGKAFSENMEKGLLIAQKLIPIIIFFTGFAAIVMFILGPFIINTFYGSKFEQATIVFQLLTLIPLIVGLSNVLGISIMLNLGMDKTFLYITTSGALVSIMLNLLLINRWGYIGTTVNYLLTEIFIVINMYISLRGKGINVLNSTFFNIKNLMKFTQLKN